MCCAFLQPHTLYPLQYYICIFCIRDPICFKMREKKPGFLLSNSIRVYYARPDDDSPESKHVAININSIVVVLTDDIL